MNQDTHASPSALFLRGGLSLKPATAAGPARGWPADPRASNQTVVADGFVWLVKLLWKQRFSRSRQQPLDTASPNQEFAVQRRHRRLSREVPENLLRQAGDSTGLAALRNICT